jgi:hypothetical protein
VIVTFVFVRADTSGTPEHQSSLVLMHVTRAILVGPAWEEMSKDVGITLRQGTFAMVHMCTPKDAAVIKVSRFDGALHLEQ